MDNVFFCYSNKLHYFLEALGFKYNQHNTNKNSKNEYWSYDKTEKLNKALAQWEILKKDFSPYMSK